MSYDGKDFLWENRNLRTNVSVIGQVVYKPGGTCGPRIQKDYELVIIHSGSCFCRADSSKYELKVDHISFFPPGHREYFYFSEKSETHHSWCTITPSAMPEKFRSKLGKHLLNIPCSETFKRLLASAFQMENPLSLQAGKVIDLISQTLFAEFLRVVNEKDDNPRQSACNTKAIRFMEAHFHEENCLANVHAAAGVSRNTLITHFKDELKTTPDKFLWKLRTERGIAMLVETGLTISEIAYRCGFKNPFHFSRLSTIHNGASPRAIRKKAWSNTYRK